MRCLLSALILATSFLSPLNAGELQPSISNTSSLSITGSAADCLYAGSDGLTLNADCDTKRVGIGITNPSVPFQVGGSTLAVVNGRVGIGVTNPASKLDVEGSAAIGATYSGTSAAPANGLIVEGSVGIGTTNPSGVGILNKAVLSDAVDDTAAADGTYYALFRTTAGSSSPAASAEVGVLSGQYNWRKGDNQTFTAQGVEGVVRAQGADESMTARGVYGRFYIDPDYSATLRTGIGGEFSARASYSGGTAIAAESGTAFVGSRIWMAPYFSAATIANVNNFHGLWIYNEATTQEVTNGIKLSGADGSAFTNDLNLQNGEVIGNYTDGTISLLPYTLGTSSFTTSGLTVGGNTLTLGATFYASGGKVGIGNTDPTAGFQIGTGTGDPWLVPFRVGASSFSMLSNGNVGIGTTNPGAGLQIGTGTTDPWATPFLIGSSTFAVTSSGDVGIGDASPDAMLEVQNDGSVGETAPVLMVSSNNAAGMVVVRGDGRVGVGLTNPGYTLEVGGNSHATSLNLHSGYAAGWGDEHEYIVGNNTNASVTIAANSAAVLTVLGSSVGIGTTNPGQKLSVQDGVILSTTTTGFGVISAHGSSGACLMLRDTDGLAWTECKVSGGVMSCATDADGVCD